MYLVDSGFMESNSIFQNQTCISTWKNEQFKGKHKIELFAENGENNSLHRYRLYKK